MCGARWEPESGDTSFPGSCPGCGARSSAVIDRCDSCPVLWLDHARSTTAAGRLLERVLTLDANSKHLSYGPDDVTVEEAQALRVLDGERSKWEKELSDRRREDWEMEQRVRDASRKGSGKGF